MNRHLYLLGIIFNGLHFITALFQIFIFSQIGYLLYQLQSFSVWTILLAIISLIGSVLILIYFYYHQHWVAFITGIIVNISGICLFIIIYLMSDSPALGFQIYYLPVLIFSLGAKLLYGLSLVLSKARKNPLLLIIGGYILLIVGTSIFILFWSISNPELQTQSNTEIINLWLSLAETFILIPYIILFYKELKSKIDKVTDKQNMSSLVYMMGGLAFMVMLIVGIKIYEQTYWKVNITPDTKAMVEQFDARTFVDKQNDTLKYLLLKPLHYEPEEKQYPLVVNLPYNKYEGASMAQLLSGYTNRSKFPSFLLVPYCPPGEGWGGIPNYPAIDTLVFKTIIALENEFAIDENKIYVTGISRGGYGTWHFISLRPEMFAAAIPVSGAGDPKYAPKLMDVSIWAFHGAKDKNVLVSGSRNIIKALRNEGRSPRYTEYHNKEHDIWEEVKVTTGLLDWLFAQEKDSL